MFLIDRERSNFRRGFLGYSEVFMLMGGLAVPLISFAKELPFLVTKTIFNALTFDALYFLPL